MILILISRMKRKMSWNFSHLITEEVTIFHCSAHTHNLKYGYVRCLEGMSSNLLSSYSLLYRRIWQYRSLILTSELVFMQATFRTALFFTNFAPCSMLLMLGNEKNFRWFRLLRSSILWNKCVLWKGAAFHIVMKFLNLRSKERFIDGGHEIPELPKLPRDTSSAVACAWSSYSKMLVMGILADRSNS